MKGSDRSILVALPLVALVIGLWVLVIGPKRNEASELDKQAVTLQAEVDSAEAQVATAEQAQDAFATNYSDLVSLGAAVPEDDDQAVLIKSLTDFGRQNSLSFRSFTVVPGTGAETQPAPAAATPPADGTADAAATPPIEPAPATEASAASLPLGATVGAAGLPVTPYELDYRGHFFDLASLFGDLTGSVDVGGNPDAVATSTTRVHGRLLTIDGFHFSEDQTKGFPTLSGELKVTTFLVPPEQGISLGASPAGPVPTTAPEVPAGATPEAAGAPTATVTP